jgi:hypothetical protein
MKWINDVYRVIKTCHWTTHVNKPYPLPRIRLSASLPTRNSVQRSDSAAKASLNP